MDLGQFFDRYRKVLGVIGVATVLGSWIIGPILMKKLYNVAPLDTAFLLTVFWAGVWSLNVLREKYL